jgi:hypothetical protein
LELTGVLTTRLKKPKLKMMLAKMQRQTEKISGEMRRRRQKLLKS